MTTEKTARQKSRKSSGASAETAGKNAQSGHAKEEHATTPDSATSLEKERLDEDAVEKAVTVPQSESEPKSILPCPPIPPNQQREAREGKVRQKQTSAPRKASKKTG